MLFSFYYISIPRYNRRIYGDCPITHFIKKYGYTEFLPIPKSIEYKKNQYLFCIPKIITVELIDILTKDGCFISHICCEEIDSIDLTDTIVDEKLIWTGCCYETIYSIKPLKI